MLGHLEVGIYGLNEAGKYNQRENGNIRQHIGDRCVINGDDWFDRPGCVVEMTHANQRHERDGVARRQAPNFSFPFRASDDYFLLDTNKFRARHNYQDLYRA